MNGLLHNVSLCGINGCRRKSDHSGEHNTYPTGAWEFLNSIDKNKINKAGFATPRGGHKGAYQNHVNRNNQVILPYERLTDSELTHFQDGFVIRVFPEQYFESRNTPRQIFLNNGVVIGDNAFVLYRTHDQLENYPPLPGWETRYLEKDGQRVDRRGEGVVDRGHYVLRIAAHGTRREVNEGPPQGIFAPEYCNLETNFLSKCLLAWLITRTSDSPYVTTQGDWLEEILHAENILDIELFERKGLLRLGISSCPLCLKHIRYQELHDAISFSDEDSLLNAPEQVFNSVRSTVVNLFHINPLTYRDVCHTPENVAWGHAVCNTKLGQRKCFSIKELEDLSIKIAAIQGNEIRTFAWASESFEMLRSPRGAVWIRIATDHLEADIES